MLEIRCGNNWIKVDDVPDQEIQDIRQYKRGEYVVYITEN